MNKTQEHYIAYIDILGYKDFLKSKPNEAQQYLDTILDAVERIKRSVQKTENITMPMFDIKGGLRSKIFSDNILVCMPVGNKGKDEIRRAIVFLTTVAAIQRGMILQHGLLVRGGITLGELFMNEDIVFGQGLIEAVSLEAKAEYPCIMISNELVAMLKGLLNDVTEKYNRIKAIIQKQNQRIDIDSEEKMFLDENLGYVVKEVWSYRSLQELLRNYEKEPAFVNYLFDLSFNTLLGYEFAAYVNKIATEEPEKFNGIIGTNENIFDILLAHKEIVIKKINENCNYNDIKKTDLEAISVREKIIRKYIWLLRYHNSICTERKFQEGLFLHSYGCDQNILRLIVRTEE